MIAKTKSHPGTTSFVRFKLGLSQQQLADALGVSRSMVAMVETGKRKFSGPASATYLSICHRAAAINPHGYLRVKRGRKPASPVFLTVTNSDKGTGGDRTKEFVAGLEKRRQALLYQELGLRYSTRSMKERSQLLSDRLTYVTAMLKVSNDLKGKLPPGNRRDKHELSAAFLYARQIALSQKLKKYGPVAQLALEFQAGLVRSKIEVLENHIEKYGSNPGDQEIEIEKQYRGELPGLAEKPCITYFASEFSA